MVMVYLHSNENSKKEVGTRDWDIVIMGLTMCLLRGIWTLVFQVIKAGEFFKHCLTAHTSRKMEDRVVKSYLKCRGGGDPIEFRGKEFYYVA